MKLFLIIFLFCNQLVYDQVQPRKNYEIRYSATRLKPFNINTLSPDNPFNAEQIAKINASMDATTDYFLLHTDGIKSHYFFEYSSKDNVRIEAYSNVPDYFKDIKMDKLFLSGGTIAKNNCISSNISTIIEWNTFEQDTIINNYKCNKALDKKSGAIAFYTSYEDIKDGPYHFTGLSGLIIELQYKDFRYRVESINITDRTPIHDFSDQCKEVKNIDSYIN